MATVDPASQPSIASSTGRGRGRGRVAFLNFGRRQQQAPEEPLQDQQQPLIALSDSQPQQSGEPDRPRGRSRRGRPRRGGKGKGKEEETSSETGRATPLFERGDSEGVMGEKGVQQQPDDGHGNTQRQDRPANDEENLGFTLGLNPYPQPPPPPPRLPSPSSSRGPASKPAMQKRSSRSEEELRALIESERGKMNSREKKPVPVINPNAVRDMKRVESQRLSIDVRPSPSYNNWGDAPPPGSRQAGGRRKGKEKEKGSDSRRDGSRKSQQRQEDLPQGSHLLGDTPQGSPPNQRRAPPTLRRLGGHMTETGPERVNTINSPRAATPDQDRPKNSRVVPPRSFGGHLTSTLPETDDSVDTANLRPNAKIFEPGKPVENLPPHLRTVSNRDKTSLPKYDNWGPGGDPSGRNPQRPTPRTTPPGNSRGKPKQQSFKLDGKKFPIVQDMRPHTNTFQGAEDIGTRVHKEIASGVYECMICYGGLTRKAKIWNCKCCWAVFHLNCVQKWAKQGLEQPPSRQIGADGEHSKRSWRCPACNNPDEEVPETYTCWCEKTVQPEASKYLPPHRLGYLLSPILIFSH